VSRAVDHELVYLQSMQRFFRRRRGRVSRWLVTRGFFVTSRRAEALRRAGEAAAMLAGAYAAQGKTELAARWSRRALRVEAIRRRADSMLLSLIVLSPYSGEGLVLHQRSVESPPGDATDPG
jgi:hypothetical protein